MAALNFPSSPTNGQVFGNWIYSSSKGAWQAKPLEQAVALTSPTAPASPTNGDLWYNTNDGSTYVHYTDVDGSQWVELKSDVTLSSTIGPRVDALELRQGLVPISPTSVSVASGTGSIDSSGLVTFNSTSNAGLIINGCFSSLYKNYKIVVTISSGQANGGIGLVLTQNGTPNTGGYLGAVSNGATTTVVTSFEVTYFNNVGTGATEFTLYQPFEALHTAFSTDFFYDDGGTMIYRKQGGKHRVAQSFDGFKIFGATSSAGTVRIYGMR